MSVKIELIDRDEFEKDCVCLNPKGTILELDPKLVQEIILQSTMGLRWGIFKNNK